MKVIDEINNLSKIGIDETLSHNEGILSLMRELAERVVNFLKIERINVWLLNQDKSAIFSIAEFDKRTGEFTHGTWIYEKDIPTYFKHLKEDKIILSPNIHTHPATFELSYNYAREYDVISLMDIPMRLNGELIGVICFEKIGSKQKIFNEEEQLFAITVSQLIVTQIENYKRISIQKKLEKAVKEQELIIKELNHRVKNNFSVLVSLLRMNKEKAKNGDVSIFETFEHQLFSLLKMHELLLENETYDNISLNEYLKKLCQEFQLSYTELEHLLKFTISDEPFEIPAKLSVNLGLMITEIFLNSLKYCVIPHSGYFELMMKVIDKNTAEIVVGDSGNNFNFEKVYHAKPSLGLSIIKDLAQSSGFEVHYPKGNSKYVIVVRK